ncbi:hypothetical protein GM418_16355 [Maribellus comscasis]|uniref:Outer membrane protein beta-barrel domain-containing protein n=1 Tax=Maribellus comscasis TaxID=2681766 RepID=A0A6I6JY92_9BACT|nr:hypothetical protein [Maribellus comscasis]QGY45187.1 hypothetical protein GM418_16355 [Maribellus comscasis]
MKKLLLFFFAIFVAFPVFSQLEKGHIHLKNGTVLKGKYQFSDDKIHIISAGNLWTFEASEVDTIIDTRNKKLNFNRDFSVESALFYRIEAGLLIGNSQNSQSAPFSLTGSVNYRFEPRFSLGAGFGAEFFNESYLPVFLNLEYKLNDNFSSPYVFLKGGYQIALEDGSMFYYDVYPAWNSIWPGYYYAHDNLNAKGGVLIHPGVGYTHMFSSGIGMSFAFGYQFHRLQYKAEEDDYRLDVDYNRLVIKIGILFN